MIALKNQNQQQTNPKNRGKKGRTTLLDNLMKQKLRVQYCQQKFK